MWGESKSVNPQQSPQASEATRMWLVTAVCLSLALRLSLFDFQSGDYRSYLSSWYDRIVSNGLRSTLKSDFSTYPPLYMCFLAFSTVIPLPKLYAIKLISIVFDYLCAWLVMKILRIRYPVGVLPMFGGLVILFSPTLWLNSALWGQCDAM